MNSRIEKTLGKNEKILWLGRPQKTKLMDEDIKSANTKNILISLAVCVALIACYLTICLTRDIVIMWAVIVVILALGLLSITHIFTSWNSLGRVVYVITNKRVMIWHSEDKQISISRNKITETKVVTGANGLDSLCLGAPACKLPVHKLRFAGVNSVREEVGENIYEEYPVFYNILDAQDALNALNIPV